MYNKIDTLKGNLPFIPTRGIVPIPNNDIRIDIGRQKSILALEEAAKNNDNFILIGIQKSIMTLEPQPEDIYEYAAIAKITMKIPLPKGGYKVKLKVLVKAKIEKYIDTTNMFRCEFLTMPDISTDKDEELALSRILVSETIEHIDMLFNNKEDILKNVQNGLSISQLADFLVNNLKSDINKKIKYLSEDNINKRVKMLLEDIESEKQIFKIEGKITAEIKKNIDENQKEYYLREKLKAIHEELGDKAKKESDIEVLRTKILEAEMPQDIEEKVLKELSKYESLPSSSGESGVTRNYIDWMLDIPWSKESEDNRDLVLAEELLNEDHYGLEKVKERILEFLAVKTLTNKIPTTILCLVGPPGVGKTSLVKSIAKSLNRKYVKVALGGVKDESEIRGHRRTYLGSMPGKIIQTMKKAKVKNPVFLLDEIDKMASDYKGDPASAMLEVLDPEQNREFNDHYIEENYDLSSVFFIATANYYGNIPEALRDRMEIIHLSSYTEFDKFNIAKKYLVKRQLKSHGLGKDKFSISNEAIRMIIKHYTRESGIRELERILGSLVRKSIKAIMQKKQIKVKIGINNVEKYLGKKKYNHNMSELNSQVGVVTGLAYTKFGGDTLPIEVTFYKGKGKLVLTGKLGDVMKESALAAMSYVKTNSEKYGIDIEDFNKNDIHIHVPEGAVPKDGPSAGVTITTGIISALTNKAVDTSIGMTGEVTLRGNVLPIGGVKEKSIAAHRSGLRKIILPFENEKDIEDIPKDVLNNLEVVTVKNVSEILPMVFK